MVTLGIWDGHDAGAALLIDGQLVVAINEERLTRRKLEVRFPERSIRACLEQACITPGEIDRVGASTTDPSKALGRILPATKERYYAVRRRKAVPGVLATLTRAGKYRLTEWQPTLLSRWISRWALTAQLGRLGIPADRLRLADHHACHAWAAACASGFDECAVVTVDGVGDGHSASIWDYRGRQLAMVRATPASQSLGVFFEQVTRLLNMRELEDEGKVMALADYASPVDDGDNPLLGFIGVDDGRIVCRWPSRSMSGPLRRVQWRVPNEQFAFMGQRVVERVMTDLVHAAVGLTGHGRVALAGGVASNIKANRKVRLMPDVSEVYVFPHMGDGGLAVGAALAVADDGDRRIDLSRLDLGPSFDDSAIRHALDEAGLQPHTPSDLVASVAELLRQDRIVLWFNGRMEYGPRALGYRSVLARPDRPALRQRLNLVLKQRVWYQPFCPSMLDSEAPRIFADWDEGDVRNRHMTMTYMVKDEWRDAMAGVTNIDGSCRPQLVQHDSANPFARLLSEVGRRLGLAVLLNTSLNIHGEPLVCSPAEAVDVLRRSGADALAIGPFLVDGSSVRTGV